MNLIEKWMTILEHKNRRCRFCNKIIKIGEEVVIQKFEVEPPGKYIRLKYVHPRCFKVVYGYNLKI